MRGGGTRRRYEAGQALEQLERREAKFMATVHIGLGEPVDQASLRRGEGPDTRGGVKPLQGDRRWVAMAHPTIRRLQTSITIAR
jgi:hypothetical protein